MATDKQRERVLILGAAGRDFHIFNVCFRDDANYQVVAFTATQIPGIELRRYPASLSGSLYPDGIPIYAEAQTRRTDTQRAYPTGRLRLQRCLSYRRYASRVSGLGLRSRL